MATIGISTRLPVGGTRGRRKSISMSWVNVVTISSTTWSQPTVREMGVICQSAGIFGMKWSA